MTPYQQEVLHKLRLGQIDLDGELAHARQQLRATNCPTMREAYQENIRFLANLQDNKIMAGNYKIFLN